MSVTILPEGVRLRRIAVPIEHGGWGFLLEPIVLGFALESSVRGGWLAVAACATFLIRQPMKVWWSDFAAGRTHPRSGVAVGVAAVYGAIAVASLVLAFRHSIAAALPLLLAGPLVVGLVWFDARGKSRDIVPELVGPVALASVAASMLMLGGRSLPVALAVWGLLSLRGVPSVLYVRSRLRLEYGRETSRVLPVAAHAAAIAAALWLAKLGLAPFWVVPLYAILLLRAAAGLSALRRKATAKAVGFSEIGWGAVAVLWIALAFRLA
ncbi:MAG: YwiC-like family protein [Thermoanaerobaculia bacterium]